MQVATRLQPTVARADDACVLPVVAALSLEEKGFVLGAARARVPAAEAPGRVPGPAGARCAAALAALAGASRPERAAELAALTALVRAAVPAGIERIHPDWLRERLEAEPSPIVRAVAAGLPEEVRRVAADVLRGRGAGARLAGGAAGAAGAAALQRLVFAGLVPLAGPGAPTSPIARELAALATEQIVRAIETRGAEALGRSLRGGPPAVVAQAAASVGDALAPVVLEAARGPADAGDGAARKRARAIVEAAGLPPPGEAAFAIGACALAAVLADEGGAAILAVAQRLPAALGRRLLAAAPGPDGSP
jgi:hypothetical protein